SANERGARQSHLRVTKCTDGTRQRVSIYSARQFLVWTTIPQRKKEEKETRDQRGSSETFGKFTLPRAHNKKLEGGDHASTNDEQWDERTFEHFQCRAKSRRDESGARNYPRRSDTGRDLC